MTTTEEFLERIWNAEKVFRATPTVGNRVRLNYAIKQLRRYRPGVYRELLASSRPEACTACGAPISVRLVADLWRWSCGYCGKDGVSKREIIS